MSHNSPARMFIDLRRTSAHELYEAGLRIGRVVHNADVKRAARSKYDPHFGKKQQAKLEFRRRCKELGTTNCAW